MSKQWFSRGLVLLVILSGLFIFQNRNRKEKEIHYHAGFQVYIDGKLQDFSSVKYMTIKPCGAEGKEDEQMEKAHLHDGVGDVVHVEAEGAKWKDLFENINFKIQASWPIAGYVNSEQVTNILTYPISPYDSVVIFVGKSDKKLLKDAVAKKSIREVERKSEGC